jgi:hydrogenase nickel incorporation protein HypA/HybF
MHELAVAAALFEWADGQQRTYAPRRLVSIELELDGLSCLNPDALQFGFSAMAADTSLSAVTLEFFDIAPIYECATCGATTAASESPLSCPTCSAPLPRLSKESSLRVRSIEVE